MEHDDVLPFVNQKWCHLFAFMMDKDISENIGMCKSWKPFNVQTVDVCFQCIKGKRIAKQPGFGTRISKVSGQPVPWTWLLLGVPKWMMKLFPPREFYHQTAAKLSLLRIGWWVIHLRSIFQGEGIYSGILLLVVVAVSVSVVVLLVSVVVLLVKFSYWSFFLCIYLCMYKASVSVTIKSDYMYSYSLLVYFQLFIGRSLFEASELQRKFTTSHCDVYFLVPFQLAIKQWISREEFMLKSWSWDSY